MDSEVAYDFEDREMGLRFLTQIAQKGFKFDSNKKENRPIRFKDSIVGRILQEQYLFVYTSFGEKRPQEKQYNESISLLQKLANEY